VSDLGLARRLADTVLLEGYVLYPYRASSLKNRYRWTFGVLAPRAYAERDPGETWWLQAQLLVEGEGTMSGRLRFLEIVARDVQERDGDGHRSVPRLVAAGVEHVAWEEGRIREVPFAVGIANGEAEEFPFALVEQREVEPILENGSPRGRVVRTRQALRGRVSVRVERLGTSRRALHRLTICVENQSEAPTGATARAEAMPFAFASTHLLLAAQGGVLLSATDPPAWAQRAAADCVNVGVHPVIVSALGAADQMLCSPIILPDHPALAPESGGDFFDAGEIDELLVLRTSTLTDEEKAQVRATDPRAAALLDRVERITPEERERLHGAVRYKLPPSLMPGGKVVLRPRGRSDAQDVLYAGMVATVQAVLQDVDGSARLAVTIDADPAAELHQWYGRYHYYRPDEVEAVERPATP
jgi:hypothetical protein